MEWRELLSFGPRLSSVPLGLPVIYCDHITHNNGQAARMRFTVPLLISD